MPLQLQDAVRDAPSFLKNAQETALRSPVNEDTLYLWDNQVTAIEKFLASTEDLVAADPKLGQARKELFDLKRQIQNKVLEFELKAEGQEMPPEPTDEELVEEMMALAADVEGLCKDLEKAPLKSVKDLDATEEGREMLNSFLVDTEALQGKNKKLDAVRAKAKATHGLFEAKSIELIREWRLSDSGDDDDD